MNKVLILTGCSRGLGSEIKEKYLRTGYKVIGIDNHDTPSSHDFVFINVDLNKVCKETQSLKSLVKKIRLELPSSCEKLILINNAAIQTVKEFEEISLSDLEQSFSVNVFAPFILIQALITELEKMKGQVINILSVHTKLTKKFFTCYSSSKAALESITKSLSIELAEKKIRVIGISPAAIETDMLKAGFEGDQKKLKELKSYHPVGQIGQPDDLSNFIFSISENEDIFLSGTIFDYTGAIQHVLHDPI